jgi:hypothetical protein
MSTYLAAGSLALGVLGAGSQAAGAKEQAQAQQNEANYQAQVAANNTIIANQNAEQATAAGSVQAQNIGLETAATGGAIKAAQGANNVDVNTGSNVLVQKGQRKIGALSQLQTRANAALQAYGYKVQAQQATEQGQLYQAEAQYAPIAGDIGATGSLLSGVSSAGSRFAAWYQGNQNPPSTIADSSSLAPTIYGP